LEGFDAVFGDFKREKEFSKKKIFLNQKNYVCDSFASSGHLPCIFLSLVCNPIRTGLEREPIGHPKMAVRLEINF